MDFALHPRLVADTVFVADWALCRVLLMNDARYPWIILVPRVVEASEWIDLSREQQHQLSDEIAVVSHILQALVTPEKLNVAALGNQVRQLHVHLIARYCDDAAWPNPVWGGASAPYEAEEKRRLIRELKTALDSLQLTS